MNGPGRGVLFVTGATGLVGRETVRRSLAAGTYREIACLVRRVPPGPSPPGVRYVAGDVRLPGLGLDAARRAALAARVTDVLHAAADTRFERPHAELHAVNVEGTRRVLDLAQGCRRLRRFLHLSTVHVAGLAPGRVPEAALGDGRTYANPYQRSKHEAEAVVLERAASLPVAIARLGTLVGESADGRVLRPSYVHALLRLLPLRLSPVVALDPAARVDLVASDWALDAAFALLADAFRPGTVSHVCAGPDASLSVSTLMDEVVRAHEEAAGPGAPSEFRLPEVVSVEAYHRFVDDLARRGLRGTARILRGLELFLPHLRIDQVFEVEATRRALGDGVPPAPSPLVTVRRVLRWGLATDWGEREAVDLQSAASRSGPESMRS